MKNVANKEIRAIIKASGLTHWEIAEALGFGESTFSRLLRKELVSGRKKELISRIEELEDGK